MNEVVQSDLTLRDILNVLSRRRSAIVIATVLLFAASVVLSLRATRRYEATSVMQLQKSNMDSLNLESLMGEAGGGSGDALTANIDLQTQSKILQSDELALRVIKDLNLESNVDFVPHHGVLSSLAGLLHPHRQPLEPMSQPLEESPQRRERMLTLFHGNLKVTIVSGTRLIEVAYDNPSPKVAAMVANDLVTALSEYTFQTKFKATTDASRWLEAQLGDLRRQSTDLQTKVSQLQKQTGLFGVGGTDLGGKPVIYSPILDRFQQSNAALAQAQSNRLIKGSIAQIAKSGDADLLSQLSGPGIATAAGQGVTSSLVLMENLRTQQATLEQQVSRDATVFGPAYPRLIEEKAALARIQQSLAQESLRIADRAQNDYAVAQKTEEGLRRSYEEERAEAQKLNDRTIDYVLIAKEADQSQQLYNDLLRRLREAGILEGLRSSNIAIVSQALPPATPRKPDVPLYLAAGLFGGMLLGVFLAFLVDAIDNKVRGPEEIEAEGITLIGVIPSFARKRIVSAQGLDGPDKKLPQFIAEPKAPYSEAIRALRSTLMFAKGGSPPRRVMITSGSSGEGKSTLAVNLAVALAQLQRSVLLVELDLRRPVLARRLGLPTDRGLATLLTNASLQVPFFSLPQQNGLKLLPCGPVPPFPAELLGSPRMDQLLAQWSEEFDFIVLDCPPVLPVADAQSFVERVDFTILVARPDRTSRVSFHRAFRVLEAHQVNSGRSRVGAVLNALSFRSTAYYGYYGYKGYSDDYRYGGKRNHADI